MGRLTVRHGHAVVHGCNIEQAQLLLQRCAEGVAKYATESSPGLKNFPDDFNEMRKEFGLSSKDAKAAIGPSLATDVRDLARRRGADVHIVPAGKCERVMAQARTAMASYAAAGNSVEDDAAQSDNSTKTDGTSEFWPAPAIPPARHGDHFGETNTQAMLETLLDQWAKLDQRLKSLEAWQDS